MFTLVRICDLVGRPRGTRFVADDRGTVVTSHVLLQERHGKAKSLAVFG